MSLRSVLLMTRECSGKSSSTRFQAATTPSGFLRPRMLLASKVVKIYRCNDPAPVQGAGCPSSDSIRLMSNGANRSTGTEKTSDIAWALQCDKACTISTSPDEAMASISMGMCSSSQAQTASTCCVAGSHLPGSRTCDPH